MTTTLTADTATGTITGYLDSTVPAPVVTEWTGQQATRLRAALRLTQEAFAAHLGVAQRTVAMWAARPDVVQSLMVQEILDTVLDRASTGARARFALLTSGAGHDLAEVSQ
jgi:DNA-binding transcriptional regulator YiaG